MKTRLLVLTLALLIASCKSGHKFDFGKMKESTESYNEKGDEGGKQLLEMADGIKDMSVNHVSFIPPTEDIKLKKSELKIIKNASIRYQVKDFKTATDEIEKIVNKFNGYISSQDEKHSYNSIENTLVIRISHENFEPLIKELMTQSVYTDYKNITMDDVTEEFVDIQARLKAKKEVEQQFIQILKQAKTIKDILAVENEIRAIREEIDAKEGRLKYLSDRVSLSAITLSCYQQFEYSPQPKIGFISKAFTAFREGWENLTAFVLGLIYLWPFVLVIAAVIILIVRYRRKKKAVA